MTAARTPLVLGLRRATGTTTVATALHARDGGSGAGAADLVICASTEESLLRAEAIAVGGARPWLAVVMVEPGPAPTRARLRLAARRCAGVTLLPHVGRWAVPTRPVDDLTVLLGLRPDHLPQHVRDYAAGLREIAAGLVCTGLLDRARPPVVAVPQAGGPPPPVVRAVLPDRPATVARPTPALRPAGLLLGGSTRVRVGLASAAPDSPVGLGDLDDLDDEALELAVQLVGTW